MNVLFLALSLLAAAALQGVPWPWWWGGAPHLPWLALCAAYFMAARDLRAGVPAALFAGLMQDALSGLPLGVSAAVFVAMGFVLRSLRDAFFLHRWGTDAALGFVVTALAETGVYAAARLMGRLPPLGGFALLHVASTALLGAALAPLQWWWLGRGERVLGLREDVEA